VQYLDEFVIGQENAKKVLSVACVFLILSLLDMPIAKRSVFNHYNRARANLAAIEDQEDVPDWNEINPSDGMCFGIKLRRKDMIHGR
jgi:ATP-dependent Clp protease ATP-binding subunit ClpX